jgi:hypothetical protein
MSEDSSNTSLEDKYPVAVPPQRYVCPACGKTSSVKWGKARDTSPGWDESCMMHAILCNPAPEGSSHKWIAVVPDSDPPP